MNSQVIGAFALLGGTMGEFTTRYDKICAACDQPFVARRRDARYCSKRCNAKSQPPCYLDGCARPRVAKGFCSIHYNQLSPSWHARVEMPCAVCGQIVERQANGRRPACSVRCRAILQFGQHRDRGYNWATAAAARARKAGAEVLEIFDRLEIFERDSWTCQICGDPVNLDVSPFHAQSPTVDHIVPFVLGGAHSRANAQCAHLGCNSAKDRGGRRLVAA